MRGGQVKLPAMFLGLTAGLNTETREHPPVTYQLPRLKRLPLGASYEDVAVELRELYKKLRPAAVVVDATGVGRPVVELIRDEEVPLTAVTITNGETVTEGPGDKRLPKMD